MFYLYSTGVEEGLLVALLCACAGIYLIWKGLTRNIAYNFFGEPLYASHRWYIFLGALMIGAGILYCWLIGYLLGR